MRPDLTADDTLVTVADRLGEELIRSRIEKRYPHHAIAGEEYGRTGAEGASHCWYVDPVDGTSAFVRGVPFYAVLIGLEPHMEPWDCAPFPPILQEACGYFGHWQGNPTIHGSESLATTQALLPEVLALLREG